MSDTSIDPSPGSDGKPSSFVPPLGLGEWIVFAFLAGVLAAANIYTTLLIGWGDTGSIIAVLGAVLLLGIVRRSKPSVETLNLGQTMVSAGGSIGFAVASYAAVYLVEPEFNPPAPVLILMFSAMGLLGAVIGSSVRRYMVRYFFPSGTACAVIQKTVTRELKPGERNRPVFLLKMWGGLAALVSLPTKITMKEGGHALFEPITVWASEVQDRVIKLGVDPLYYGIGMVVGPRVGLGMLIGALSVPFLITDGLAGGPLEAETGDWVKWLAIAVLTLPTFATILFAYSFRTPPVVPPGFEPGKTTYTPPATRPLVFGLVGAMSALAIGFAADAVFALPWYVTVITIAIAWPLCVVNGRVTGDTDINPVRLVAIVLLSGFFWLIDSGAMTLLGMAVVGGTLAAVAVDMMQDYRTGYLVDKNPVHQTSVQLVGSIIGACVAIPTLGMLLGQLGIGPDSALPAPGAQIWAAMAEAMAGGFNPSDELLWAVGIVSVLGSVYAFLTVWPRSAWLMPSIFGIGIGMLVGAEVAGGIFAGGLIKSAVSWVYTRGKTDEARATAATEAGNDTMLAGASVFAAAAILSIVLVIVKELLARFDVELFHFAGH